MMSQRRATYRTKSSQHSELEETLALQLVQLDAPPFMRQYPVKFSGMRNPYRLDFAWPELSACVEVQGGVWIGGGHTSPRGYIRDRQRMNRLVIGGGRVLEYTAEMVKSGEAALEIVKWLEMLRERRERLAY